VIEMKKIILPVLITLAVLFSFPVHASVSIAEIDTGQLQVISQDGIEKWIDVNITKINSTAYNITLTPSQALIGNLTECLNNILLCDIEKLKSILGINYTKAELSSLLDSPILNLTSGIKASISSYNILNNSISFTVTFPNGFKIGERLKIGSKSIVIGSVSGSNHLNTAFGRINNNFYVGLQSNGGEFQIWNSTNNGTTWTKQNNWSGTLTARALTMGRNNIYIINSYSNAQTLTWNVSLGANTLSSQVQMLAVGSDSQYPILERRSNPLALFTIFGEASVVRNATSTNQGATWTVGTDASSASGFETNANFLPVETSDDVIHVFTFNATGNGIEYNNFTTSWGTNRIIGNTTFTGGGQHGIAAVVQKDDDIFIAYITRNSTTNTNDIFLNKRSNSTKSWGASIDIYRESNNGNVSAIELLVDVATDNLYMILSNGTACRYTKSTDDGSSWSGSATIENSNCNYPIGLGQRYYFTSTALNISSRNYLDYLFVNGSTLQYNNISLTLFYNITIDNPLNQTYGNVQPLNYTISTLTPVDKCWYSFDNTNNISLPNCVNVSSLNGSHGQHNVTVYANLTDGTQISSSTVFFSYDFNTLVVFAFDETNATAILGFNATITNATASITAETLTGNITFQNFTGTTYTVSVSANNYGTRNYRYTKGSGENVLNTYLLKNIPTAHIVAIRAATLAGSPLTNIMIQIEKFIISQYRNVTTDITDSTGTASFWLDASVTYRLSIAFPSGTRIFQLTPSADSYTFFESGLLGAYNSLYQDIVWITNPRTNALEKKSEQTINLSVYSKLATIQKAWIRAYWNNTMFEQNATVTNNETAIASLSLNLISANRTTSTVTAEFYLNTSNAGALAQILLLENRTFSIFGLPNATNLTLENILKDVGATSGFSMSSKGLIALFISLLITGFVFSRFHATGFTVVVVFVGILGIFTTVGWFDFLIWALMAIIGGLYYFYQSGVS